MSIALTWLVLSLAIVLVLLGVRALHSVAVQDHPWYSIVPGHRRRIASFTRSNSGGHAL